MLCFHSKDQPIKKLISPWLSTFWCFLWEEYLFDWSFLYAQFPTRDLSAEVLYPIVWEVIRNLECAGFNVVSLTGDKASVNRKFFGMHKPASGSTYKVRNPYSQEERYIYFISDAPHLVKTVRNCWSNSFGHSYKRPLWVCVQCNARHVILSHTHAHTHIRTTALDQWPAYQLGSPQDGV